MIGRKVISTNKFLNREELALFFDNNWDKEAYNDYVVGKLGLDKNNYIILPANEHFIVAVYPIKKNFFHKSDGIVLMSYDITQTMDEALKQAVLTKVSPLSTISRNREQQKHRKEQKTVVEEILILYTDYLNDLVLKNGLLNEDIKVKTKAK